MKPLKVGAGAAGTLTAGALRVLKVAEWADLVAWTHAWDAQYLALYTPSAGEQSSYGISSVQRVASIADRIGARPLVKDAGGIGANLTNLTSPPGPVRPALPGAHYVASSARFNGRPAWRCDQVLDLGAGAFIRYISAMVTPTPTLSSNPQPAEFFGGVLGGYAAPYAIAGLVRCDTDQAAPLAVLDSFRGDIGDGPTVEGPAASPLTIACFGPGGFPTVNVNHTTSAQETIGFVFRIAGPAGSAGSKLDIAYKNAAGVSLRMATQSANLFTAGTVWPLRTFMAGYDHTNYATVFGIVAGALSDADTTKILAWCDGYIPAASTIGPE